MGKYDVIIVGASFAGLAVASQIKSGRVLLIDQKEIGGEGKSACGTILYKMKELGLEEAVLQVHNEIFLHTTQGILKYQLFSPFCIIDYQKLSNGFLQKGRAKTLTANVTGFDGRALITSQGTFRADIFVDATGPERVLVKKNPGKSKFLSFGLETILPYQEKGLHFWYEPKKFPLGLYWLFPQGETCRFGIASYRGETNLKWRFEEFVGRFGLKMGDLHGGYFPHRLDQPVVGKVFMVGDSAGQCIPLTGEGIRPAIVFGQKCGEIIEEILEGKITLETGFGKYRDFVLAKKFPYEIMYSVQRFLTSLPERPFWLSAWLVSKKPVTDFVLKNYLSIVERNFKKGGGKNVNAFGSYG